MERLRTTRLPIYAAVLAAVVLTVWTINAEFFHLGGFSLNTKGETHLDMVVTPTEMGADRWRIGAINMKEDQGVYQVMIVDDSKRELFKLTFDAATGGVGARKKWGGGKKRILPIEEIRQRVDQTLSQLSIGDIVQRAGKPFAQADLVYEGTVVTRVKIDPLSGQPFDPAAVMKERRAGMKNRKWIPGDAVMPLGWLGGGLAIVGTLYFSWRRSMISQLQLGAAQTSSVLRVLAQTLRTHCWISFLATGLILIHTANDWGRLTWSVSWLTLLLVMVVTGNGVIGKMLQERGMGLVGWRRFHLPMVVLLFLLLVVHIMDQSGVLSTYAG